MKEFDTEQFETRYTIAEAAVALYIEHGESFTVKQVGERTGLDVGEIFEYFPDKDSILQFYYRSIVIRYRMMLDEIDGFEEYLLAEKLSNFIYSSFDIMGEQRDFVEKTFRRLILCSFGRTEFEEEAEQLFQEFFRGDARISSSSSILLGGAFFSVMVKKYLYIIRFWLRDDSEERERSMELTDKYTSFMQEIMYGAAVDKGLDLLKFLFSNNMFTRSFHSMKKWFPEIEIRD